MKEEELHEAGEELYEHHRFVADAGQNPLRIDKFLFNLLGNTSRNKIQEAGRSGSLRVNSKVVKANYRVKAGDLVQVVLAHPPREIELIPEDIPLDILYEDQDVCILNKQAGMVVHPAYGHYKGTLVNALLHHMKSLPQVKEHERPGLVHRLDKDTSGVMVVALNDYALSHLSRQFFERSTDRLYTALVWGDVKEEEGRIVGHIGRSLQDRKQMAVFPEGNMGKHAVTHYRVLERFGFTTLVECRLETGRTHQIRVHMKYAGHTLFGDQRYGGNKILKGLNTAKYKQFIQNCFELMPHQALHARTLGIGHPRSEKRLSFHTELPPAFEALCAKWRTYSSALSTD